MEITTTVPGKHLLTVNATNAKVIFGGAAVKTVYLERHSTPELTLLPDPGCEITQVILDGTDVTDQARGGFLLLPRITGDMNLTVTSGKAQAPSGPAYTGVGTAYLGGKPLAGAVVQLLSTGATVNTNASGSFTMTGLRPGKDAFVVYKDGLVAGYMPFTLEISGKNQISVNADGSLHITVDATVQYFTFDLVLDGTGHMTVTGLAGVYPFYGSNPHTGDIIAGIVAVMLLSGGALALLLKKRKKLLGSDTDQESRQPDPG